MSRPTSSEILSEYEGSLCRQNLPKLGVGEIPGAAKTGKIRLDSRPVNPQKPRALQGKWRRRPLPWRALVKTDHSRRTFNIPDGSRFITDRKTSAAKQHSYDVPFPSILRTGHRMARSEQFDHFRPYSSGFFDSMLRCRNKPRSPRPGPPT